jgi:hypothetical protein
MRRQKGLNNFKPTRVHKIGHYIHSEYIQYMFKPIEAWSIEWKEVRRRRQGATLSEEKRKNNTIN